MNDADCVHCVFEEGFLFVGEDESGTKGGKIRGRLFRSGIRGFKVRVGPCLCMVGCFYCSSSRGMRIVFERGRLLWVEWMRYPRRMVI